jgi:hypothetical protein
MEAGEIAELTGLPPEAKEALQNATTEAVNQARMQAVLSTSEALTNLQASMDLKGFEPGSWLAILPSSSPCRTRWRLGQHG